MDLTTSDIFILIKKKIKEKKSKTVKTTLPSISIVKRLELLKQQNKEENIEKYFKGLILNESNIANFIYNSYNPKMSICFNNLEYLSIAHNYLINLEFIVNFPDLFYLDVFGNPLEDFNSLNYKNIFGYLRLSVDKFHENKILTISGLNCAILDIEIKDKNILKLFRINNPNIFMFNNAINYYIDKLANKKNKIKAKKTLRYLKIISNNTLNQNNNRDQNNQKKAKYLNFNEFMKKFEEGENISHNNSEMSETNKELKQILDMNNSVKKINIDIQIKNNSLLEIKDYFVELSQVLEKISKKTKSKINASHLVNDSLYLNIEKKRILLLYKTYLKLNYFNREKKSDYFFCKNINAININKFTDEIRIYEIKNFIKCININIRFGLIILITILFYTLNLISMKLSISIIHYILLKHYKFDEHKQVPNFNSFGEFHCLCYYLDILEDFKSKLKFAEKSQIDLYQNILDILEIKKLILKSNLLKQKKEEYEKKYKNLMNDNSQKDRVSSLLLFLKDLQIDKDIFILIEFFCDFIIYEDMEQVAINGALNDEYSTLIEIKEILEQMELDKNNLSLKDLSNKKYYKNKLERIFNKFYFENNKIKIVKNKNFKNVEDNKISFTSSKFNLLSFIFNWNKDYMKTDQVNIKNCFVIDKLKKNKLINNDIKKLNNNFSLKEKDFSKNIGFSEENKNFTLNEANFNTIFSEKSNINSLKTSSFKDESNISKKYHYKTNYNNSKFLISSDNKRNNSMGIKSTKIISEQLNQNKEINSKNSNLKSNTFKDLFKYFDNKNKDKEKKYKFKNLLNKRYLKNYLLNENIENNLKIFKSIKKSNYYKTLNCNEGCFPFNTVNKEEAKLKIKQIDTDIVNINAHRLFWKKDYNNSRENIRINNENFSDGLLVEKYNQAKQVKIINKIIENKNREIKEKIDEQKNLNKKV